ncbi:MAG: hypothetical protein ABH879_04460 [archaeon]
MKQIVEFLEKTEQREFRIFLKLFQNLPRSKFAVVKISGATLEKHMDLIAEDIAYLNGLGIYPIIVHGAGSALDSRLTSKKVDGLRITTAADMKIVEEVFDSLSQQLVEKIESKGGAAKNVAGVFRCTKKPGLGCVGEVRGIDTLPIAQALDAGCTPILNPLGLDGKTKLNVNADTAARELVKAISPMKFILLTETGGILDEKGRVIPFVNISDNGCQLSGGMLLKVREITEFLREKPGCAVVITSAMDLLKEMFTIKGRGTYIKFHKIEATGDIETLDKARLRKLLEDAFDKVLAEDYFSSEFREVFYQQDYEAVAIIKDVNGVPYLDKFATAKFCQGTGLGKSLWAQLAKKYPALVWRADPDNPANSFYCNVCDGMVKKQEWHIFWKGIDTECISPIIGDVNRLERTML